MESLHIRKLTPVQKFALIVGCVVMNLAGQILAQTMRLPVWLDTIGSSIAVGSVGMGGAFAVAFLSVFACGIGYVGMSTYAAANVLVILFQTFYRRKNTPKNFFEALKMGFWTGLLTLFVTSPVYLFLSDGKTTNIWGDAFHDMLEWNNVSPVVCSFMGVAVVEVLDKQICSLCSFLLLFVLANILRKYSHKNSGRRMTAIILFCVTLSSLGLPAMSVQAEDSEEKYVATIYNNSSGLYSSEANDIAETEDGYIWIGSYAGLTRYDGKEFELIREGGMVSITAMHTDSKGILWVGTNGGKVAMYRDGTFSFYELADSDNMNSVRCFEEASDGSIYIGTTGDIFKIDANLQLHALDTGMKYASSMVFCEEGLVGCNYDGQLFLMQEDSVKDILSKDMGGTYYTCINKTSAGLLAGTSGNEIEMISIANGKLCLDGYRSVQPLSGISDILEDSTGKLWIAAENGCGYIGKEGPEMIHINDFEGSVESIHEDYEGNIWLASTRYGVAKLSQSSFGELFAENGIAPETVNSICVYEGLFYCGTDSGLVIIDRNNGREINNELTELLENVRIRCVKTDSRNRLWICTYSDKGLVCYSQDGNILTFTEGKDGTTSNRFRSVMELADGTIVAGASNGLNFIEGTKVVKTLAQKDGLNNPQILCMLELKDGSFYAGTDGAGIYHIKDKEIIGHIGKEEGLSSQVVMRITEYEDGFFVVSGTSLCYMKDGIVKELVEFPYYNNYDAIVLEDSLCVLASAGVYLADAGQLISGGPVICKLYNYSNGLEDGLTSNAWNYVDEEGVLYFASNGGVYYCNLTNMTEKRVDYKFSLASVMYDGVTIKPEEGVYQIPADAEVITLVGSVRNYLCTNVKIRLFVKEITASPETVSHAELETLQISNLRHGEYTICMQIMDDDGITVLQEQTYKLVKDAHIWETNWYKTYLIVLGLWMGVFILWMFVDMRQGTEREKELERIKYQAKGEFLTNMSHEFRTPVNTILGMNEMIMQAKPDEHILEYSDNIKKASVKLLSLINDVLDYSAIESGKLDIIEDKYYLENMLTDIITYLKSDASTKGVETEYNIEDNLPAKLLGDEGRVKQVIMNILSNAVKYTEEGQVVLSVGGTVEKETFFLTVTVADTGIGISEENLEKIFAEFDRLEFDKDRRVEGIGLGLSIASGLIKQMGGSIALQSVEGSGSVFTVVIPQKLAGSKRIGIYSYVQDTEKAPGIMNLTAPDARVLAVDDNRMNLSVISGLLKRNGILPDVAFGGAEALELCKKNKYDLIFMDHMMPYPDGIETLHQIRNGNDVNKETPIVVLTANAVAGARSRYLAEGFDDYMSKPVDVAKLEATLLRYLPMELQIMTKSEAVQGQTVTEAGDTQDENEPIVRAIGLQYCGGNEKLYEEILQSYYTEGLKYREKLQEHYASHDWEGYAITAHTLKSTSLGIGAAALSKLAKIQELAAKTADGIRVAENHERFLLKMDEVLEIIGAPQVPEVSNEPGEAISDSEYLSALRNLREYVANYEMVKALEIITYLKQVTKAEAIRAVLQEVEDCVNEFDYADAEEKLKKIDERL